MNQDRFWVAHDLCSLIIGGLLFCSGILGYSEFVEPVAQRRYIADWGGLRSSPFESDILIGIENCNYLGRKGFLITKNKVYKTLISDCKQKKHNWPKGYLGDVNQYGLRQGILILGAK